MEQSLSDLLSDAFSETSVPSFPDGDLDFESLNFDEKIEEDKTGIVQENLPTEEDMSLHQEATDGTSVLSGTETKDVYLAEDGDEEESDGDNIEEDYRAVTAPGEDYMSLDGGSGQEGPASGEDEGDEEEDMDPGETPGILMSVCSSENLCYGNKEDRIFAEGQPLAPEAPEKPQLRNKDQGESESETESDEEVSYFGLVPEHGYDMMVKGDRIKEEEQEREEEKQEDSSDSESEPMKVEQGENVLALHFEQEVENPYRGGPTAASLEFPEISAQNLQDLIAEVDSEEYVEKMKDFSGEEHQEAGESFADYPSDFSSCEYVQDGVPSQESDSHSLCASDSSSKAKQNLSLEGAVTDILWMGREKDNDEEGDGYLYSRDLERDSEKFGSFDVAAGEKDRWRTEVVENVLGDACESDSYSSSDDEIQVRRDEGLFSNMSLENDSKQEDTLPYRDTAFFSWSFSDTGHFTNNKVDPENLSRNWDFNASKHSTTLSEDLLTTEDADTSQHPAGDINHYSVVQREDSKNTRPSYQGSLDDSFFFNTEVEASSITELGQLGDDEDEDETWEQERERIKAFNKFYCDEENERKERQIRVQFCTNPLSQVICYETDSSDQDSLSSSTDREEDLSSAETSEELREPDNTLQTIPVIAPPDTQLPEPASKHQSQTCSRKYTGVDMLKLMLKMGLVIVMGLLMFWLVTDQPEWLSHTFFFQG